MNASWFKDGLPIQRTDAIECGISHDKCYISVDKSVPALSGEYTCVISNPYGSSHRSNKVVVLGISKFYLHRKLETLLC